MLKSSDIAAPTASASTAAAMPMPVATKMYTASFVSSSVLRNRTSATMPARLKASVMLCCTSTSIPDTAIGRMISVWTSDWRNPFGRRVSTWTQATGIVSTSAPIIASAGTTAGGSALTSLAVALEAGWLARNTTESTRAAASPAQLRSISSRAAGDVRHNTAPSPASAA